MAQLFTNNASTTTTSSITASDTFIAVTDASHFASPASGGPDYQVATLTNTDKTVFEIVHITFNSNNYLSCIRGQEGTTAVDWAAGVTIFSGVTAGILTALLNPVVPPVPTNDYLGALSSEPVLAGNPISIGTTITDRVLMENQDDQSVKVTIPYSFIFNGVDYGNDANGGVWITANSQIIFGPQGDSNITAYWDTDIANAGNAIALNGCDGMAVSVTSNTPAAGEALVIFFDGCANYSDSAVNRRYRIQFALDGNIGVEVLDYTANPTGVDGFVVSNTILNSFTLAAYTGFSLLNISGSNPSVYTYELQKPLKVGQMYYKTTDPKGLYVSTDNGWQSVFTPA